MGSLPSLGSLPHLPISVSPASPVNAFSLVSLPRIWSWKNPHYGDNLTSEACPPPKSAHVPPGTSLASPSVCLTRGRGEETKTDSKGWGQARGRHNTCQRKRSQGAEDATGCLRIRCPGSEPAHTAVPRAGIPVTESAVWHHLIMCRPVSDAPGMSPICTSFQPCLQSRTAH